MAVFQRISTQRGQMSAVGSTVNLHSAAHDWWAVAWDWQKFGGLIWQARLFTKYVNNSSPSNTQSQQSLCQLGRGINCVIPIMTSSQPGFNFGLRHRHVYDSGFCLDTGQKFLSGLYCLSHFSCRRVPDGFIDKINLWRTGIKPKCCWGGGGCGSNMSLHHLGKRLTFKLCAGHIGAVSQGPMQLVVKWIEVDGNWLTQVVVVIFWLTQVVSIVV